MPIGLVSAFTWWHVRAEHPLLLIKTCEGELALLLYRCDGT